MIVRWERTWSLHSACRWTWTKRYRCMTESRSQSLPAPRQLATFLRRRRADLSTSCWGPSQLPTPSWLMPSSRREGSRVPRRLYWCRSRRTTESPLDLVSADLWPLRTLESDLKHKSLATDVEILGECPTCRRLTPPKKNSKADIDDHRRWLIRFTPDIVVGSVHPRVGFVITSPAGAVAKYCDEYVSVWVCLSIREDISGTAHGIFTNFCACCLCPWLDSLPACWR